MTQQIELTVASLPSHNEVVVEIYIDGRFFALVSQDVKTEPPKIEFANFEKDTAAVFTLSAVEDAIGRARDRLERLDFGPSVP